MGAEQWVSGIQHIGIPTSDIEQTIAFYEKLGFQTEHRNTVPANGAPVAFLRLKNLVIETYGEGGNGLDGAINHFALDCTDIEAAYQWAKEQGFVILSEGIEELPFWENGVAFFIIQGPNLERIEFCERK
ncbi:MAG: VOC family protein [Clostridiales bacterium]|nr:VOC family protein [Clostridiales bacterium]